MVKSSRTREHEMTVDVRDLKTLLDESAATPEFKAAVRAVEGGQRSPLVEISFGAPRVKVLRVISKLLEVEPGLRIEKVHVDGYSGCSDFRGRIRVNDAIDFDFVWDCRWRAKQEGWNDVWGYPDQGRAAQAFGYQCFQRFERVSTPR